MSFKPTELRWKILDTVCGLQFRDDRRSLKLGMPARQFRSGVPFALIMAELTCECNGEYLTPDLDGALAELIARGQLEKVWQDVCVLESGFQYQPVDGIRHSDFDYRHPDGRIISLKCERSSERWLCTFRVDGHVVGEEHRRPDDPSAYPVTCYRMTANGLEVLDGHPNQSIPPDEDNLARHSDDFRSVYWFGTEYSFTSTQAAIIRTLWENWERGTPEVSAARLLEQAGAGDRSRLVDIFRKRPAWNTMIVAGGTKGSYRLTPPS